MTEEHRKKAALSRLARSTMEPGNWTDCQKERFNEIKKNTPRFAKPFHAAYSGKSKAAAIKAKCLDCACWHVAEVTHCQVETCPLWPVRPYQQG